MHRLLSRIALFAVLAAMSAPGWTADFCASIDAPERLLFAGEGYRLVAAERCGQVESRRFRAGGEGERRELLWRRYLGDVAAERFLRGYVESLAHISIGRPDLRARELPGEPVSDYLVEARTLGVGAGRAGYRLYRLVAREGAPMETFEFRYRFPERDVSAGPDLTARIEAWRRGIVELDPGR
ncbi:hypothetical protein [Arhodomonas sp. AD133]|uniref:hypothetical protein n=1 Tax=Arhodomonas sp. AD133 TaxID=3415009 RepID=UPI003EBD4454